VTGVASDRHEHDGFAGHNSTRALNPSFGNARTKLQLENQLRQFSPDWWLKQTPPKGARNAYHCSTCGQYIVTIDMDKGTTPIRMGCKATEGCNGASVSSGYPPEPMPAELESCRVFEWYRPEASALGLFHEDQLVDEYIRAGGLLLRERE
jgi:hypothetical protein